MLDRLRAIAGVPVSTISRTDRLRPVDVPDLLGDPGEMRDNGLARETPIDDTLPPLLDVLVTP